MGKLLHEPSFSKRSTSPARLPPTSAPLPSLPASAYTPPSPTEELELLPKTFYAPPSTSKDLSTLPATAYTQGYSHKRSNGKPSNDPSSLHYVEPRSVTVETPTRTHFSLLSPPASASPPLRKKACRSPLFLQDEVQVESLVLITVQPPTPGTASPKTIAAVTSARTSVKAMKRLDAQKRKKRNLAMTKTKNRQSMVLVNKVDRSIGGDGRRMSFYRGPKKSNHDSFNLYGKGYRKSYRRSYLTNETPEIPRIDSRKSIFYMIKRPAEATSPPPPASKITFEQMYLQILEERWTYYRQLNAMREADEKREVEEYLATHPAASAASAPSVPASTFSSASPSGRKSARQAHREVRAARLANKLSAIAEGEGEDGEVATKTMEVTMKGERRVTVSSPHLFPHFFLFLANDFSKRNRS